MDTLTPPPPSRRAIRSRNIEKVRKQLIWLHVFMVCLIIGFSLILYPLVGNEISSHAQSEQLKAQIVKTQKTDYTQTIGQAREINTQLANNQAKLVADESFRGRFKKLLYNDGTPFGRVIIKSAQIDLPVYVDTSDDILEKGAGLFIGSSIPVETGTDTNTVITAHTGLPNATMFDNLTKVKKGDTIIVSAFGKYVGYKTISTQVLPPDKAIEKSFIKHGKNILTLITCTPYSINSHRLVVTAEKDPNWHLPSSQDSIPVETNFPYMSIFSISTVLILLMVLYVWQLNRIRKK